MIKVLQKGENILLPNVNEIIVAIKWLKKPNNKNTELDIDSSAFLLTDQNKVRTDADFIFYNQPTAENNAIILKNNCFKISITSIPNDISRICFSITLHNAEQKQQNFSLLENISVELFNFADKQKLLCYSVTDINSDTAMILSTLYRYNNGWKFKAIGQSYNRNLAFLAKNFGVSIEEETSKAIIDTQPVINNEQINANTNPVKKASINTHAKPKTKSKEKTAVLDIHNTDMMTKQEHYIPIVQWFENKNCRAVVNETATDTSGFFDEVAVILGNNYELLKIVSDTIKRRQFKNYDKAYIDLSNYNDQDAEMIKKFCKQLYNYTFVARYFYDNKTKKIILTLQSASKIVSFFNGEWLEWYAMMKIATLCHEKNINFSCIRNMLIYPAFEQAQYEIDLFFLINGTPLFIECKSGEYRGFIDKYSRLRKKLFMRREHFIMLISGIQEEHINGLNAMFDISFMNETRLISHIIKNFAL
jgi:stress response protein SCP2